MKGFEYTFACQRILRLDTTALYKRESLVARS